VLAIPALFFVLLIVLVMLGQVTIWIPAVYAIMSVVLFAAYGADKAAAQRGESRTSEKALHLMAAAGGWPGALVAQRVFRHKTMKRSFRRVFWLTVTANCLALAAWVSGSSLVLG